MSDTDKADIQIALNNFEKAKIHAKHYNKFLTGSDTFDNILHYAIKEAFASGQKSTVDNQTENTRPQKVQY